MADLTIAQLTQILAAGVDNADLLPLWDDTAQETKKITIAEFLVLIGADSLNHWSGSFSSATQATSQWTPLNAAANVNAAITPKGTGAFLASMPDGTATGGGNRGTNAVDLQMVRTASNQVASGTQSVITGGNQNLNSGDRSVIGGGLLNNITPIQAFVGGGYNNQVSGQGGVIGGGDSNAVTAINATVAGGASNTSSQTNAFVGGGGSNLASAVYSTVVGGISNTASGAYSFVGGGANNTASGTYSSVSGGYQATASLYGQKAHASGRFSANGDAQAHQIVWRRVITGTAQTELFLDGSSIAAILPATNSLWQGTIEVASICTSVGNGTTILGNAQGTTYKVTIKRLGTSTTLVGTVQEIGTNNADPSALGVFVIDANDTNESLRIRFTPPPSAGSTTVHRVVATFRGLQIQY